MLIVGNPEEKINLLHMHAIIHCTFIIITYLKIVNANLFFPA